MNGVTPRKIVSSGTSRGDALDHEHVHADRRGDQPELDHHDDDDAEPHRVVAQRVDDREHDRDRQQDHRQRIEQAAEDEIHPDDDEQDRVRPSGRPVIQSLTRVGIDARIRKLLNRMAPIRMVKIIAVVLTVSISALPSELAVGAAIDDPEHEGADRADAGGLGRREDAEIEPADHQQEQRGRAPDAAQRDQPRSLNVERAAGGPSVGLMRVMIAIASMKPATVRIPGRKPARNSVEMLVSVNRP